MFALVDFSSHNLLIFLFTFGGAQEAPFISEATLKFHKSVFIPLKIPHKFNSPFYSHILCKASPDQTSGEIF